MKKKNVILSMAIVFAVLISSGSNGLAEPVYWPPQNAAEWETRDPESVGMDAVKLDAAIAYAMEDQMDTLGIVVLKNGYIVGEAYDDDEAVNEINQSFSVAKSFTSALVGIGIEQGLFKLEDNICQYYDAWDCSDKKDKRTRVTIKNLLTLTAGLDWHEDWSCPLNKFTMAFSNNDAVWMHMSFLSSPIDYVLDKEGIHEPGTHFEYSTGSPELLSGVIETASGMNAFEYAKKNLLNPLGITNVTWDDDSDGHTRTYATLAMTTRDYAKFGYLYLRNGKWKDQQLVPESWVQVSTSSGVNPAGVKWYGYLWHVNLPVKYGLKDKSIPADAYAAQGIYGQRIFVIPSKVLVVAKNATEHCELDDVHLLKLILQSVAD
jgi:CubicO group peptidase (beta-lactamase class C family)